MRKIQNPALNAEDDLLRKADSIKAKLVCKKHPRKVRGKNIIDEVKNHLRCLRGMSMYHIQLEQEEKKEHYCKTVVQEKTEL